MKNLFIFFSFLFACNNMLAHTHKVSSVFLIKEADVWNVQVSASFTAYQYEMLKEMSKEEIKELSPEDVQHWISNHLKNNLSFIINDKKVNLGESYIQLGHEIKAKILLENGPDKIDEIIAKNTSFLNSGSSHKSYFKVVLDKKVSDRFIMGSNNQHELNLDVYGGKVVPAGYVFNKIKKVAFPVSIGLIFIILLTYITYRINKQRKLTLAS